MSTSRKDNRSDRGGTRDEPTNEIKRQILENVSAETSEVAVASDVPAEKESGVARGHVPGHLGYTNDNLINVSRTSRDA